MVLSQENVSRLRERKTLPYYFFFHLTLVDLRRKGCQNTVLAKEKLYPIIFKLLRILINEIHTTFKKIFGGALPLY